MRASWTGLSLPWHWPGRMLTSEGLRGGQPLLPPPPRDRWGSPCSYWHQTSQTGLSLPVAEGERKGGGREESVIWHRYQNATIILHHSTDFKLTNERDSGLLRPLISHHEMSIVAVTQYSYSQRKHPHPIFRFYLYDYAHVQSYTCMYYSCNMTIYGSRITSRVHKSTSSILLYFASWIISLSIDMNKGRRSIMIYTVVWKTFYWDRKTTPTQ